MDGVTRMSYRSVSVRVLLLLACAIVIVVFKSSGAGSRAQNRPARTSASERVQTAANPDVVRLSAPTKPASGPGFRGANLAVFDAASSSNLQLQTTLEWSFGGKMQRGWSLYTPLIDDLIGVGVDPGGNEFAMRLSLWQKERGTEPSGVLDGLTWTQMVAKFQSRRIGGRPYPAPNQLVTI